LLLYKPSTAPTESTEELTSLLSFQCSKNLHGATQTGHRTLKTNANLARSRGLSARNAIITAHPARIAFGKP